MSRTELMIVLVFWLPSESDKPVLANWNEMVSSFAI